MFNCLLKSEDYKYQRFTEQEWTISNEYLMIGAVALIRGWT